MQSDSTAKVVIIIFFPSEKTIYEDYGERIFFTQWEPSLAANAGKRNEERDLRNVLMGVKGVKPH